MAVVKRFNVNKEQATLDADIIENMSANDVSYNSSLQYDENTVGDKLSELEKEVIYDVTVNNNGTTFASLSELLSDENLSTLIPVAVRCGGMSIRFVQSSDNKYVQYMYNCTSTTVADFTNTVNWEKMNLKEELSELNREIIHNINKKKLVLLSSDQFASMWQNKIDHIEELSIIGSNAHFSYSDVVIISNIGITDGKFYFFVLNVTKNYSLQYILNESDIPQDGIVNIHYEKEGSIMDAKVNTNDIGIYISGSSNTIQVPFTVDYGSNSAAIITNANNITTLQGQMSDEVDKIKHFATQIFIVEEGTYKSIWNTHLGAIKSFSLQLNNKSHGVADKIIINVMGINSNTFRFWLYDVTNGKQLSRNDIDVSQIRGDVTISRKTEDYVLKVIVDLTKVGIYINSFDGSIIVPYTLLPDDSNAAVSPNLIEIENIAFRKIWDWQSKSYIDDNSVASDRICSGIFPVREGYIYKSNKYLEFTKWLNAGMTTLGGSSSSDETMFFDVAITGSKFASFSTVATRGAGYPEKWIIQEVASADDIIDENIVGIHIDGIKKTDYEDMLANGYKEGDFVIGCNDKETDGVISLDTEGKLISIAMQNYYEGTIKSIDLDVVCDSTFDLQIGLGTIDQRPIALPRKFITVNVSNGTNHIAIPKESVVRKVGPSNKGMFEPPLVMQKNEVIFIKADANSIAANAGIALCESGFHYEQDTNLEYMVTAGKSLSFSANISGKKYLPNAILAKKVNLDSTNKAVSTVQSEVSLLDIKNIPFTSPNGSYFKLAVSNEGVLSVNKINSAGKILIFGNSYDIHDKVAGAWWDDMGMAASRKENDWKHKLIRRLLVENNILLEFDKASAYFWERYNRYTVTQRYASLDGITEGKYDLVIVRCGENTPVDALTDSEWVDATEEMLDTIISKVGASTPIIFGGALKYRTPVNVPMKQAADEYNNVTWVDMTPLGSMQPFECGMDYNVLGDDGVWHKVSESSQANGVAIHPGNNVQAAMADTLYPYVLSVFQQ